MNWILLIALVCQQQNFEGFKAKPAPLPAATVESVVEARPNTPDVQQQLIDTQKQLSDVTEQYQRAVKDLTDSKTQLNTVQSTYRELLKNTNDDIPPIDITGLGKLTPSGESIGWVHWRIYVNEHCGPCHAWVNTLKAYLASTPAWKIGDGPDAHFRLMPISDAQWQKNGWQLPRFELFVGDIMKQVARDGLTPADAVKRILDQVKDEEASVAKSDKLMGMKVGELPVTKSQVEALLQQLTPFLDGGTLQITYTPRAGIVKEYLTIKQGTVALKIPARTSIAITCNNRELAGTFAAPSPQVTIPIRGNTNVKSMTLTPYKFAIQLPWMIDPEFTTKDAYSEAQASDAFEVRPQMELDEEVHDEHELFGAGAHPRSGHWPVVQRAFCAAHPYCAACGTVNNPNVHHIVPFHDNPGLELDPNNLVRLCRDCHFKFGHDPDGPNGHLRPNWSLSNPNVLRDSADNLARLQRDRTNPR